MILTGLLFGFLAAGFCWGMIGQFEVRAKVGFQKFDAKTVDKIFKRGRKFKLSRSVLYSNVPLAFLCGLYFNDIRIRYALGLVMAGLFLIYCLIFALASIELTKKNLE